MKTWQEFIGPESWKRQCSIGYDQKRNRLILISGIGGYDYKNKNNAETGGDRYPTDAGKRIMYYDMALQAWSTDESASGYIWHAEDADTPTTSEPVLSNFAYSPKGELCFCTLDEVDGLFSINNIAGKDDFRRESEAGPSKTFEVRTRDMDFGEPGVRKKVYRVYVTYKSHGPSHVRVTYDKDGKGIFDGEFVSDSDYYNSLENTRLYRGMLSSSGYIPKNADGTGLYFINYNIPQDVDGDMSLYQNNYYHQLGISSHGSTGNIPQYPIKAGTLICQARPPFCDSGFATTDSDTGPEIFKAIPTTSNTSSNYISFYRAQLGTTADQGFFFGSQMGPNSIMVVGNDDSIMSATAVLKPEDSVDLKDIKSFALQFKADQGVSAGYGETNVNIEESVPHTFEISDITIIYRLKSTK
jgi:hypothetical protein